MTVIAAASGDDATQELLWTSTAHLRHAQVLNDLSPAQRVWLLAVYGVLALLLAGLGVLLYRWAMARRTPQLPGSSAVPIPDPPSHGRVPGIDQSSAAHREEEAR